VAEKMLVETVASRLRETQIKTRVASVA